MCEKCRMIELFDEELARFESYDNGEAFSIARHRYALERRGISEGRAMVIAHIEPFQGPAPPSRAEMNAETRIREAISELESIAIHNYRATLGIERTDVRETAPYKIGRAIQGLNMALDEIKANRGGNHVPDHNL